MAHPARPIALITGIAEGLGASIARTFAAAGYDIAGLSRSERAAPAVALTVRENGGTYTHIACDIGDPTQVAAALPPIADRVAVLIHNAQQLVVKPAAQTSFEEFEQVWRVACFGAMAVAKSVLPSMTARVAGTLIFTGATASTRAGANFAAFASAKFALRGLTQSLAREYGPKGVHVAHVIIDGLIAGAQTDKRFGPASAMRIEPDAAAQTYLNLAQQHPSAWTHELDLRPRGERF